jgi:hypothetical protein
LDISPVRGREGKRKTESQDEIEKTEKEERSEKLSRRNMERRIG